jgi:hypothetical protein
MVAHLKNGGYTAELRTESDFAKDIIIVVLKNKSG